MRLVYCNVKLTILVIRGNPGNEASVLQCEAHNIGSHYAHLAMISSVE